MLIELKVDIFFTFSERPHPVEFPGFKKVILQARTRHGKNQGFAGEFAVNTAKRSGISSADVPHCSRPND